ncbi:FUSC family protein [Mycoplasma sp. P36-A1]|uniref:FUSC family protein n=1 Tax=Mycoplasma sp. P36-A1 TaxID=3252900 RepID=UPI003C2C2F66
MRRIKKIVRYIKDNFPLRIIKTCIGFFISLITAPLFGIDSFFAGVGSLKTMQQSIYLSINEILNQTFANIIGVVFAIVFSLLFGINAFSVSIAIFCLFLVIKHTNIQETYLTAAFVLFSILYLSNNMESLFDRSFIRIVANIYGMFVALLVNIILFRPKKGDDLNKVVKYLNRFIHIYMANDQDEYSALAINSYLSDLKDERDIIKKELKLRFISKSRKNMLLERLKEVELVLSQVDVIVELPLLSPDLRDEIIPVLKQLDFIRHYEQDKSKIPNIRDQIRKIYLNNTSKYDFFSNSSFLASLNDYLNKLYEY